MLAARVAPVFLLGACIQIRAQHLGCDLPLRNLVDSSTAGESVVVGEVCPALCPRSCPPAPAGTCTDDPEGDINIAIRAGCEDIIGVMGPGFECPDAAGFMFGKYTVKGHAGSKWRDFCPVTCGCNNASVDTGFCSSCVSPPSRHAYSCTDDPNGLLAAQNTSCASILGVGSGILNQWVRNWTSNQLEPAPWNYPMVPPALLNQHNWVEDRCRRDPVAASQQECGCLDPYARGYRPGAIYEDGSCDFVPHCDPAAGWTPPDGPQWEQDSATASSWTCHVTAHCDTNSGVHAAHGGCETRSYGSLSSMTIREENHVFRHVKFVEQQRMGAADSGGALQIEGGGARCCSAEGKATPGCSVRPGCDRRGRAAISFSLFWNCEAARGGAISAQSGASVSISFTTFGFNRARSGDGGAIFVAFDSRADIITSTFYGNTALMWGGAIAGSQGPALRISSSNFFSNWALTTGHVYSVESRLVKISRTSFAPFADWGVHRDGHLLGGQSVQIAGVPYDCKQHPCNRGQSCSLYRYSLSCAACPNGSVGLDGILCTSCPAGTGPNPAKNGCNECRNGTFSSDGVCNECPVGFNSGIGARACVDIDECAVNFGGCDILMGTEQQIGPCKNKPGSYQCNQCPKAYHIDGANDPHVCIPNEVSEGQAAAMPTTWLALHHLSEAEFAGLNDPHSTPRLALLAGLATSLGVPRSDLALRVIKEQSGGQGPGEAGRRRRLSVVQANLEVVITSADSVTQRKAFTELATQLQSTGSLLLSALPMLKAMPLGQVLEFGISCPRGSIPSGDRSKCNPCAADKTSEWDNITNTWLCADCPAGRIGTACELCKPGFFALAPLTSATEPCHACESLKLPTSTQRINRDQIKGEKLTICPGGVPGRTAGVCPIKALWLFTPSPREPPELFECEEPWACLAEPSDISEANRGGLAPWNGCHDWLNRSATSQGLLLGAHPASPGALCSYAYEGFMCSQCRDGYSKVDGQCVECPGYDYGMIGLSVGLNFAISFFLLHKSTKSTVAKSEIEDIWYKVDLQQTGTLGVAGIAKALEFMGVHIETGSDADGDGHDAGLEAVQTMMVKHFGARESDGAKMTVAKDDFVLAQGSKSPTAALGTAIFFIQTFSLLAKEAEYFSAADGLNMDAEKAMGKCVSPLTYSERFIVKAIMTPAMVFVFILLSTPLWNLMRNRSCFKKFGDKMYAPTRITRLHTKRAALNAYLFVFAPETRGAVEALVCKPLSSDPRCSSDLSSPDCVPYLATDMGVRCYEGEHLIAVVLAVVVLAIMVVLIPVWLVRLVRDSRRRRDFSLKLRADQTHQWFDELDKDNSGCLDLEETKVLLRKMHEPTDAASLKRAMLAMDPESGGEEAKFEVTRDEFEVWYNQQLENLVSTPFDILFGTNTSPAYWWFLEVLWLKTLINILYTAGYNGIISNWHIWMHCALAVSVILMVNQQPYISAVDKQVELIAMLSLAAVTHVSSIYSESKATWSLKFKTLAIILFVLPVLTLAFGITHVKRKNKQQEQANALKRAQERANAEGESDAHADDVVVAAADGTDASRSCCGRKTKQRQDGGGQRPYVVQLVSGKAQSNGDGGDGEGSPKVSGSEDSSRPTRRRQRRASVVDVISDKLHKVREPKSPVLTRKAQGLPLRKARTTLKLAAMAGGGNQRAASNVVHQPSHEQYQSLLTEKEALAISRLGSASPPAASLPPVSPSCSSRVVGLVATASTRNNSRIVI